MKLTIATLLFLVGCCSCLAIVAQASLIQEAESKNNDNLILPTLDDVTKEKILDLDDADDEDDELGGSGDDNDVFLYEDDDDDDDDDYDEDYYDEDEEYYDDDDVEDDDWTLDETSGDGDDDLEDLDEEYYDDYDLEDDDIIDEEDQDVNDAAVIDGKNGKVTSVKKATSSSSADSDWHFADYDSMKKTVGAIEDSDLLYEYYAEDYEEDYEDRLLDQQLKPEVVSQPEVEEEVVITVNKVPVTSNPEAGYGFYNGSNNLLVSVFVASGLASFAVFTLAFVLCYWQRRRAAGGLGGKAGGGSNLPFVIDVGSPAYKPVRGGGGHAIPPSSIVKSYQRVPTSTKEFLSSSSSSSDSTENPTHVYSGGNHQVDNNSSEKPLLP